MAVFETAGGRETENGRPAGPADTNELPSQRALSNSIGKKNLYFAVNVAFLILNQKNTRLAIIIICCKNKTVNLMIFFPQSLRLNRKCQRKCQNIDIFF